MDNVTLNARVQHKHALEVQWLNSDFIPLLGEIIIYDAEIDADGNILEHPADREPFAYARAKIGDGKSYAKDLAFLSDATDALTADEIDSICDMTLDNLLAKIAVEGESF